MNPIIGIDLGTTNSAVAYMIDGKPALLLNRFDRPLTPSVVTFDELGRPVVGQRAGDRDCIEIASIKRKMGGVEGVEAAGRQFSPVEISAIILGSLKSDAERRLGQPIHEAVISVPAYFNDHQRRATRDAANLAGLRVARLVNEPTAASLAYGLDLEKAHTVLVWDLGGGTFDVSILELGDELFEVKAVGGNTHLGGDDYDQRLADLLADEFDRRFRLRPGDGHAGERMLRRMAERAKVELSDAESTRVVWPGRPACAVEVTRDAFESATADITRRMVAPTLQALADAGIAAGDLDRVVLVGGMTRVPAVRSLTAELTGLRPYTHIDPDTVVALGAAVQAGVLAGQVRTVTLVDVTPLSLGIETEGGLFARVIQRNTPIPAGRSRLFTNARDDQVDMDFHILQGERELADDNLSLGRFHLEGLSSLPRGQSAVEVCFDIDANGMVQISATDLHTESAVKIRIDPSACPDPEAAQRLAEDAERHRRADQQRRRAVETRIRAQNLLRAADESVAPGESTGGSEKVPSNSGASLAPLLDCLRCALDDDDPDRIAAASDALERSLRKLTESQEPAGQAA